MENIRFGRPNASDEEVMKASQAVGADEFISDLAEGYATEVEERAAYCLPVSASSFHLQEHCSPIRLLSSLTKQRQALIQRQK